MITACSIENGLATLSHVQPGDTLSPNTIWLDVKEPDDAEREWVENLFHEDMPEEEELDDIESSSRYRIGPDGVHILSVFPQMQGNDTYGVNISFTLRKNLLVTFREDDVSIARILRYHIRHRTVELRNALDVVIKLQELKTEHISDLVEDAYHTLDTTADQITDDGHVTDTLNNLIHLEELNSQILLALYDTRRALKFIRKAFASTINPEQTMTIDEVLYDIESILPHTSFLANKINFQLEASMGNTNHKQNKIIKIFSVASVVFMPPTWIASLYGMNFQHMPELEWVYGYPFSLGMMALSAILTYLFFKKKGWL